MIVEVRILEVKVDWNGSTLSMTMARLAQFQFRLDSAGNLLIVQHASEML
jgi:hypothetical protein